MPDPPILASFEVPPELLEAVVKSRTLPEAIEAWEAINYYNEAIFFALQKIWEAFSSSLSDSEFS